MNNEDIYLSLSNEEGAGSYNNVSSFVREVTAELAIEFSDSLFKDEQLQDEVLNNKVVFTIYVPFLDYLSNGFFELGIAMTEDKVVISPKSILDLEKELHKVEHLSIQRNNYSLKEIKSKLEKLHELLYDTNKSLSMLNSGAPRSATIKFNYISDRFECIMGSNRIKKVPIMAIAFGVPKSFTVMMEQELNEVKAIIEDETEATSKLMLSLESQLKNMISSSLKSIHITTLSKATDAINRVRKKFDMHPASPLIMEEYLNSRLGNADIR